MANPIIPQQGQQMNVMQMFNQFKGNPLQFMIQQKFNIPSGTNNPQDIVQHLLNSGQITQQQVNQAKQMLPQFNNMLGNIR